MSKLTVYVCQEHGACIGCLACGGTGESVEVFLVSALTSDEAIEAAWYKLGLKLVAQGNWKHDHFTGPGSQAHADLQEATREVLSAVASVLSGGGGERDR